MKKQVKLITASLAVGMAAVISGCGGCLGCNSCAGCNGETAANTITRSNWYTGTSYSGIQPSFIEGHDNFSAEKITYDVTFDKSGTNNYYEVDYKDGIFKTEFYATYYDWADDVIPVGYAPKDPKKEVVYCYKMEFTATVKYTMKVGDKATSDWIATPDKVVTESYFRAAGKNLQPVYSKRYIKSNSPANLQPASLKDAYKEIEVTYENFYNYSCNKVLTKTTENGTTDKAEHKVGKNVFDNSSLYIVARSMKLSSSLSQGVALFSAAAGGVDNYAIVGSDKGLTAKERANYTAALTAKGLYKSTAAEGEKDEGVAATAVTVSFNGGDLHGTSQTVWYAAITNADHNISRTTMLKLSVPVSFSLGTLNYSLKEVESTLWNE